MSKELSHYIFHRQTLIEDELNHLLPESKESYHQLFKAARYATLEGGKRLRPLLTLATAEMFGAELKTAIRPACALELVHTYSLIHDDLPCMDDDDFRRGKPSLHKAFPESHAVLTGDFLLTYAFDTLASSPELTSEQRLSLIKILAEASGGHGMIAGQILDIEAKAQQVSLVALEKMHQKKTGALFTAALLFGGIIANASLHQQQLLKKFGGELGLAYQITDDLLDAEDDSQPSYVKLLSYEKAREAAQSLLTSALNTLQQLQCESQVLANFAQFIVNRTQ